MVATLTFWRPRWDGVGTAEADRVSVSLQPAPRDSRGAVDRDRPPLLMTYHWSGKQSCFRLWVFGTDLVGKACRSDAAKATLGWAGSSRGKPRRRPLDGAKALRVRQW